jgi:hypothetical protein
MVMNGIIDLDTHVSVLQDLVTKANIMRPQNLSLSRSTLRRERTVLHVGSHGIAIHPAKPRYATVTIRHYVTFGLLHAIC